MKYHIYSTGLPKLDDAVQQTHGVDYKQQKFTFLVQYFFIYGGSALFVMTPTQVYRVAHEILAAFHKL